MNLRRPLLIAAVILLLATLWGGGRELSTGEPVPPDPGVMLEQTLAFLDRQASLFNDMADALGSIDSQQSANAVAGLIAGDFQPRAEQMMEDALALAEPLTALSQEQLAGFHAAMEALLEAEQERLQSAEARFIRAGERFGERAMRLDLRFVTAELEEAMLEFGESMEQFAARFDAMDAVFPEDPVMDVDGDPPVGSAAWCRKMADTPQSRWTMNDGFAFASHCVGQ